MDRHSIGARLASLRRAAGMTQHELGARVGWVGSAISKIEKGERGVHLEDAAQIAQVLGVPVTALTGEPTNVAPASPPPSGRTNGVDTDIMSLFQRVLSTWERDRELALLREENERQRIDQVESVQARERLMFQENLQRILDDPHRTGRRDEETAVDG